MSSPHQEHVESPESVPVADRARNLSASSVSPSVAQVLMLQRGVGNAAVARLLARDPLDGGAPSGVADPAPQDAGAPAGAPPPPGPVAPPAVAPAQPGDDEFDFSSLVAAGLQAEDAAKLREMYQQGAKAIAAEAKAMEAAAAGDPARLRQVADWAVAARNELKAKIRNDGVRIVKVIAEARNIKIHGNPLGPSAEGKRAKGLTDEQIVKSATKTNTGVNKWAGRLRIAGRIMIAIDLGIATYRIIHAETDRPHVIGEEVGGIAGAIGGGAAGAKLGGMAGGAIGAWFGGVGAVPGAAIGAVIGGIGGAIGGGLAGRAAGGWVADQLYPPAQTAFEGAFSTE